MNHVRDLYGQLPSTRDVSSFYFCAPQRLLFGWAIRHRLPALLARLRLGRIAFVCDPYFARAGAPGEVMVRELKAAGAEVALFARCSPDPSLGDCDAAHRLLRQSAIRFDSVVVMGGGSAIDLAKVLCLTLEHDGPAARFVGQRIELAPLPLIALPTTAGTASELTPGAILVAADGLTKVALMANELRARVAIVDPELTVTCPPHVTADAGVDAMTHAIESFLTLDSADFDLEGDMDPGYSGRSHLTRVFAREAMQLCQRHLHTAWQEPGNREARMGMALASVYAGLSYASAGLNAVHALAYGVAALTHAPHGTTNAVMLPYVLQDLVDDRAEDLKDIARIFHRAGSSGDAGTDGSPHRAAQHIRDLIASVGVATDLRALGVLREQLPQIVEAGLGVQRLTKAYPGGSAAERYTRIVEAAFAGRLEPARAMPAC
jgi:alcohol dehydrogenase class IV